MPEPVQEPVSAENSPIEVTEADDEMVPATGPPLGAPNQNDRMVSGSDNEAKSSVDYVTHGVTEIKQKIQQLQEGQAAMNAKLQQILKWFSAQSTREEVTNYNFIRVTACN